jgi:hypothetical protein
MLAMQVVDIPVMSSLVTVRAAEATSVDDTCYRRSVIRRRAAVLPLISKGGVVEVGVRYRPSGRPGTTASVSPGPDGASSATPGPRKGRSSTSIGSSVVSSSVVSFRLAGVGPGLIVDASAGGWRDGAT